MRFLLFALLFTLFSCGTETKSSESNSTEKIAAKDDSATTITPAPKEVGSSDVTATFKKTAKNSEFAVFKTTSATDKEMEYYFKTLDGIHVKVTVLHKGDREVKGFKQLLEFAKYMEGYPGANGEMAGKIFELIYDKDNFVSEVKLAEVEE